MHDDEYDFRRGPGRHKAPPGAVIEAYVETEALDRQCPKPPKGCGRGLGEFCVFPDGSERHHPCIARCKASPETPVERSGVQPPAGTPTNPGGGR
jgi:hypothetical protein